MQPAARAGVNRARDLLCVAGARQARRRGGRAGLHRARADPHPGPRGAVPGRHAAAVGPRRGRGRGRRRGGGGGAGGVVAARAELETRVRTGAGPGLAPALGGVSAGRRGGRGDDRALAGPGPARLRRLRARAAGAALADGRGRDRAAVPGRARRRDPGLGRVGGVQGGGAVVRRRVRDHPADAGRRGGPPLDDQRPVPERRRAGPDHPGSRRADGRRGGIRRGGAARRAAGRGGRVLALVRVRARRRALVFSRLRDNRYAQSFLDGAGPAAIGAILGASVLLARALSSPGSSRCSAGRPCCCWRCGGAWS